MITASLYENTLELTFRVNSWLFKDLFHIQNDCNNQFLVKFVLNMNWFLLKWLSFYWNERDFLRFLLKLTAFIGSFMGDFLRFVLKWPKSPIFEVQKPYRKALNLNLTAFYA